MKAFDILEKKGFQVFYISQNSTIEEAIDTLVKNNIGVLLIFDETNKLTGILSERDIIRLINKSKFDFLSKTVSEIMTTNILFAYIEDDINYIENIMTTNRIRHIPIYDKNKLVGLISIGDIIKAKLSEQQVQNKYLMDYISGIV
jgi:CBS domain-containing protein